MIFVGYEPGSKGYQLWDAAHQHFEISCDVKFKGTQFPVKELKSARPIPAPLSNCQFPESDNESSPTSHKATRPICIRNDCAIIPKCYTSKPTPCPTLGTMSLQYNLTRHGNCSITTLSTSIFILTNKSMTRLTATSWTLYRQYQQHLDTYVPGGTKFLLGHYDFTLKG